jgi:uncharacterized metal-binding protein
MANGKTHFRVEAGAGLLLGGGWAASDTLREAALGALPKEALIGFGLGYVFSMVWLSPDLDLDRCDARRRWGPLGFLWLLYPRLFAHRGLSHDILLGTATRLAYLGGAVALVAGPAGWAAWSRGWLPAGALDPERLVPLLPGLLGFAAGCWPPNIVHVLVDAATPKGSQG